MCESQLKKQSTAVPGHSGTSPGPEIRKGKLFISAIFFLFLIFMIVSCFREVALVKGNFAEGDIKYSESNPSHQHLEISNRNERMSIIRFDDETEKYVVLSEIPPVSNNTHFIYMDFPLLRGKFYCLNDSDVFISNEQDRFGQIQSQLLTQLRAILNYDQPEIRVDDVQDVYEIIYTMVVILDNDKEYAPSPSQLESLREYRKLTNRITAASQYLTSSLMRIYLDDQLRYIFRQIEVKDPEHKEIKLIPLNRLIAYSFDSIRTHDTEKEERPVSSGKTEEETELFSSSSGVVQYMDEREYSRQIWSLRMLVWGIRELEMSRNHRLSQEQRTEIKSLLLELKEIDKEINTLKTLKKRIFSRRQLTYLKLRFKKLRIEFTDEKL